MIENQVVIRILSVAQAQNTILRRKQLDLSEVTPRMVEGIRRVFGEDLTPAQVVDHILAEVRANGDAAVRDYTRRIDGVDLVDFTVSAAEMAEAGRLIERLLARSGLSAETRADLEEMQRTIAAGRFDAMDNRYVRALARRLGA